MHGSWVAVGHVTRVTHLQCNLLKLPTVCCRLPGPYLPHATAVSDPCAPVHVRECWPHTSVVTQHSLIQKVTVYMLLLPYYTWHCVLQGQPHSFAETAFIAMHSVSGHQQNPSAVVACRCIAEACVGKLLSNCSQCPCPQSPIEAEWRMETRFGL